MAAAGRPPERGWGGGAGGDLTASSALRGGVRFQQRQCLTAFHLPYSEARPPPEPGPGKDGAPRGRAPPCGV